jgi:hypothetical protein
MSEPGSPIRPRVDVTGLDHVFPTPLAIPLFSPSEGSTGDAMSSPRRGSSSLRTEYSGVFCRGRCIRVSRIIGGGYEGQNDEQDSPQLDGCATGVSKE